MNRNLAQIFGQLAAIWKELGFNQKVSIVVAGVAVIAGLAGVAAWSGRVDYRVLYGKLEEAEAAKVVAALEEAKVPYRINTASGTITVPADKVHLMRMQLAAKGVPGGGRTGFSLFDKPNFGISDFVQRVNYTRAIQGELDMTIGQVDGVESARVLVVMPENRLLMEYQRKPSASVFLKLRGNVPLQPPAVNAIRFLVANAVEGLVPSQVTITDNLGSLLTDASDGDPVTGATSSQFKQRREYESYLSRKIESALQRFATEGVIARVSVDLDYNTLQRNETKFDPEGQVLRKATTTDEKVDNSTVAQSSGGGAPGAATNANTETNSITAANSPVSRQNTNKKVTQNEYEINKTTVTQTMGPGALKRISAAVFIAQQTTMNGTNRVAVPRSAEEMQKIRRLVQSSIGIQEKGEGGRVDELTVEEIPFKDDGSREIALGMEKTEQQRFWLELARNAVFPTLGLAVLFLFWRAFQKTNLDEIPLGVPLGEADGIGAANGHAPGRNGNGKPAEPEEVAPYVMTAEVLNQLVRENPANMTHALRTWMTRGAEKAK